MCRKPVVSKMNPGMAFFSSEKQYSYTHKAMLAKNREGNEQACMPRWLNNRRMKNQILDEK